MSCYTADENELDEPLGILSSPYIRSGHTPHHRGPINLSSQLAHIFSLFLPSHPHVCLPYS